MPCLEEADLSELAQQHITAQKSIVNNLKKRLTNLEDDRRRFLEAGDTPDTNPALERANTAIRQLRLELNGEVEVEPGSMKFVRDPEKRTADDRVEVMSLLYTTRKQYVFRDTTKEGEPRLASLFGFPTVKEMMDRGYDDIANELMVRASSLLADRSDKRNPVDFLDTDGFEVKEALGNTIEHHHIFNNVHVDENGRVEFKSFRIDYKNGNLKLDIVPSYWNAEQHGKNTQFIALMDAMHSGDDSVTHMHYYKFNDDESKAIKQKLVEDLDGIVGDAKRKIPRLEKELSDLMARRENPQKYEQRLVNQLEYEAELEEKRKAEAKGVTSKPKKDLSPEDLARRNAYDEQKKKVRDIEKALDLHREVSTLRERITEKEIRQAEASKIADSIKEKPFDWSGATQVALVEAKLAEIAGQKAPELRKRLQEELIKEKADYKAARLKLKKDLLIEAVVLQKELAPMKALLKKKGDIDQLILDTQKSLEKSQKLAELTPESVQQLYEDRNGFFSFDKGSAEKAAHDIYRPIMNEEIHRFMVRESIELMKQKYGDKWVEEMQKIAEQKYRNSLVERLSALRTKIPDDF